MGKAFDEFWRNYDDLSKLGRGQFGQVFRGRDKRSEVYYALKVIKKENFCNQFQTEKRAMELIHPNILHLIQYFEDHSRIVMVTELCDGGDLEKFMKNQPSRKLPSAMRDRFFYQIVCGLEYLHRNGYVHRDLKLANILLSCRSAEAVVKIGDFGFAKATMALMMTKTLCGTPLYQAPEILCESSEYNPRKVDQWSLGCIYFQMITGSLPYTGTSPQNLYANIVSEKILVDPRTLPKHCIEILTKILRKNPKDREDMKVVKGLCYQHLSNEDKCFSDRIDPDRTTNSSSVMNKDISTQAFIIPERVPLKIIKPSDSILTTYPQSIYFDRIKRIFLLMYQMSIPDRLTASTCTLSTLPEIIASNPIFSPVPLFSTDDDINMVHQHPSLYDPTLILNSDLDDADGMDEYVVVESISKYSTMTDIECPHIAVTESELAQMKNEEILKIRIFLSTKFRVLSPFVHTVALAADAHSLIGVEIMEENVRIDDIMQTFRAAIELYLHALMFVRSVLKTLDDLMTSILVQTSELSKLQYIKKTLDATSSNIMMRIDHIETHKLCHLDGKDKPSNVGLSEPILFQLAKSFIEDASSMPSSNQQQALQLLQLSRSCLDIVNLTLQDPHSRIIINESHILVDNTEANFVDEVAV